MPHAENSSATPPGEPAGMPSETVRTIVTLAVFVHLFIAAVAAMGVMRANSEIFSRLNAKFADGLGYPNYLLLSSFAYNLTYARDLDYDGSAEIVLGWKSEYEARPQSIPEADRIPLFDDEDVKLPIRRQRYLSMIRRMTDIAASQPPSPREIDMPKAAAKTLLADVSPTPVGVHRLRLLRIPTPAPSYVDETQTPELPPAYQGNIAVNADGGLEFTKADRTSLVAPPVQGRTPGTPPISPLGADPGDPTLPPRSPLPLDTPGRPDDNR